jgi:hypothetical protein
LSVLIEGTRDAAGGRTLPRPDAVFKAVDSVEIALRQRQPARGEEAVADERRRGATRAEFRNCEEFR